MDLKVIIPYSLVCYLFFYCKWVEGYTKLSKEEDLELDEQLKLLNKPARKTIKTRYGDIYDCVDFYQQPAFDHPLLKNHTFHPEMSLNLKKKVPKSIAGSIALEGGGCPNGTVPIRRTTKDDLIRAKVYSNMFASKIGPLENGAPGTRYAVSRTPAGSFQGVTATLSMWNHPVTTPQYTSGRIKVINGAESLEVGWTVNPALYGGTQTHLYIYTNAGASHCFNARCGYVHVKPDIPVDIVLSPVSTYGGPIFEQVLSIAKDEVQKRWVLRIFEDPVELGYWPTKIFTNLGNSATQVEWGGEVFGDPSGAGPPMGSGHDFELDTNFDAYCGNVKVVINNSPSDPPSGLLTIVDDAPRYSLSSGHVQGGFSFLTLYGGTGA